MNCPKCHSSLEAGIEYCVQRRAPLTRTTTPRALNRGGTNVRMVLTCAFGFWILYACGSAILGSGDTSQAAQQSAQTHAPEPPKDSRAIADIDISPHPGIDENLFLLYLLEYHYDSVLMAVEYEPKKASEELEKLKNQVRNLIVRLETMPQNGPLILGFQKCNALVESYHQLLRDIESIKTGTDKLKSELAKDAAVTGFATGFGAGGALAGNDGSFEGNASAALAVGRVIGSVWSAWEAENKLAEETKARAYAAVAAFEHLCRETRSDLVGVSDQMCEKHQWERAKSGLTHGSKSAIDRLKSGDQVLLASFADDVRAMPQNPFSRAFCAITKVLSNGSQLGSQQCGAAASEFIESSRLVPAAPIYDEYRHEFVNEAAKMAMQGLEMESNRKGLGDNFSLAPKTVAYCKAALTTAPGDQAGEVRWHLGRAVAIYGDCDEAKTILEGIKTQMTGNPDYHFLLARLFSLKNNPDDSFTHLSAAVSNGLRDIECARQCPDLNILRRFRPQEVETMLSLRYHWTVKYGVFNDDIVLTNDSDFPLTNVIFSPQVGNTRGVFRPKEGLKLDRLASGKSHAWVNCISVSGGRVESDTKSGRLECEQGIR